MTARQLLEFSRQHGVTLNVEDGRLHFRAPRGTMTAKARQALAEHKEELIALLSTPEGAQETNELPTTFLAEVLAEFGGEVVSSLPIGSLQQQAQEAWERWLASPPPAPGSCWWGYHKRPDAVAPYWRARWECGDPALWERAFRVCI